MNTARVFQGIELVFHPPPSTTCPYLIDFAISEYYIMNRSKLIFGLPSGLIFSQRSTLMHVDKGVDSWKIFD